MKNVGKELVFIFFEGERRGELIENPKFFNNCLSLQKCQVWVVGFLFLFLFLRKKAILCLKQIDKTFDQL